MATPTTPLNEADVLDFLDVGANISDTAHPDPISNARIRVTLKQLRPYDRNPRQSENPKFDSILSSIEARGLDHSPNISRRNPEDEHYLIIDGGNTRLEILNILYNKYKALADAAKSDDERTRLSEKAQSFFVIDCIFKPWKSESSALAGHMSENEERGDTLFVEKALAVQMFRQIYEEEDRAKTTDRSKPLTIRALAARITAQGWTVSHTHISRFEYAANQLLPVIPTALWAGAGEPLIKNLRRLEKAYQAFWSTTDTERDKPQSLLDLFFDTLVDFDDESIDLDGFSRALNHTLGERLDLPAQSICAEVHAMMAGVTSTATDADLRAATSDFVGTANKPNVDPAPAKSVVEKNNRGDESLLQNFAGTASKPTFDPTASKTRTKSPALADDESGHHRPTPGDPTTTPAPITPTDIQEAIIRAAVQLAARYQLMIDRSDRSKPSNGCDWFIVHPLSTMAAPPGNPDHRAAVWWALFRLSRTYREIPNVRGVFVDTFAQYLSSENSEIDVMLRLFEFEDDLPEEDKEHLRTVVALIRQGSELTSDNNKK